MLREWSYKGYVLPAAGHPRLSALVNLCTWPIIPTLFRSNCLSQLEPMCSQTQPNCPLYLDPNQVCLLSCVSDTLLNLLNTLYWQVSISLTNLNNNNTNLLKLPSIYSILYSKVPPQHKTFLQVFSSHSLLNLLQTKFLLLTPLNLFLSRSLMTNS